jgi:hypothetical protein
MYPYFLKQGVMAAPVVVGMVVMVVVLHKGANERRVMNLD